MSDLSTASPMAERLLPAPTRSVLAGLIDYAGLFPPAGLGMGETVLNYARFQKGPDAWALARLVLPVARLQEFEAALAALPGEAREGARFPLTALLGNDPVADMAAVCTFNERQRDAGTRVFSLEGRANTPEQVTRLRAQVPAEYELYLELPLEGDLTTLVGQLEAVQVAGKIRTGGLTPGDVPSPEAVLAFLTACAAEGVPCKATAGLHHALRGEQPLTYAADSPRAVLFGYLNIVLAATVLWQERPTEEAHRLLTLERSQVPDVSDDAIRWGGITLRRDEIDQARREFLRAVGSCSFVEPLAEAPGA